MFVVVVVVVVFLCIGLSHGPLLVQRKDLTELLAKALQSMREAGDVEEAEARADKRGWLDRAVPKIWNGCLKHV